MSTEMAYNIGGKSHKPTMEDIMNAALHSYDAKIDSKKRLTLRSALFEYYHVEEFADGSIVLSPRELVEPFSVSANALKMMDTSVENLKNGSVSTAVDLSAFED